MKKEKVLIACSGGPDSMALLDMYKDLKNVYVCHINYHKRKTANRDERIVREYCRKYNISIFVYNFKTNKHDNFQKLARDYRYSKFKEVCINNNINKIYVAHHMDDHIETYLMQKKRKTDVDYYGISKHIKYDGIDIYRPLINKTKDDLFNYVIKHNIPYGIDESNSSDKYERNRIRHNIVSKMSLEEKKDLVDKIALLNKELSFQKKECNDFIKKNHNLFDEKQFINYKDFEILIRTLFYKDISLKYITEIRKALKSTKNVNLLIGNKYLCKEYGHIYVYNYVEPYSYKLISLNTNLKSSYFITKKNGKSKEGVFVKDEDFPLTIRNYRNGDHIKMRYGTKKINRFFIDNKISSFDRQIWPVVVNSKGEVILVPGIGCNYNHYSIKYNLYVLKLS